MATKRAGKGDTNGQVSGVQEMSEIKPSDGKNAEHDARRSECYLMKYYFYVYVMYALSWHE